jgi:hypothetical protein
MLAEKLLPCRLRLRSDAGSISMLLQDIGNGAARQLVSEFDSAPKPGDNPSPTSNAIQTTTASICPVKRGPSGLSL